MGDGSDEEYDDPITLIDFEQNRMRLLDLSGSKMSENMKQINTIDLTLDEEDQSSSNTKITSDEMLNTICQPLVIRIVDCKKYPWFYKKYLKQADEDTISVSSDEVEVITIEDDEFEEKDPLSQTLSPNKKPVECLQFSPKTLKSKIRPVNISSYSQSLLGIKCLETVAGKAIEGTSPAVSKQNICLSSKHNFGNQAQMNELVGLKISRLALPKEDTRKEYNCAPIQTNHNKNYPTTTITYKDSENEKFNKQSPAVSLKDGNICHLQETVTSTNITDGQSMQSTRDFGLTDSKCALLQNNLTARTEKYLKKYVESLNNTDDNNTDDKSNYSKPSHSSKDLNKQKNVLTSCAKEKKIYRKLTKELKKHTNKQNINNLCNDSSSFSIKSNKNNNTDTKIVTKTTITLPSTVNVSQSLNTFISPSQNNCAIDIQIKSKTNSSPLKGSQLKNKKKPRKHKSIPGTSCNKISSDNSDDVSRTDNDISQSKANSISNFYNDLRKKLHEIIGNEDSRKPSKTTDNKKSVEILKNNKVHEVDQFTMSEYNHLMMAYQRFSNSQFNPNNNQNLKFSQKLLPDTLHTCPLKENEIKVGHQCINTLNITSQVDNKATNIVENGFFNGKDDNDTKPTNTSQLPRVNFVPKKTPEVPHLNVKSTKTPEVPHINVIPIMTLKVPQGDVEQTKKPEDVTHVNIEPQAPEVPHANVKPTNSPEVSNFNVEPTNAPGVPVVPYVIVKCKKTPNEKKLESVKKPDVFKEGRNSITETYLSNLLLTNNRHLYENTQPPVEAGISNSSGYPISNVNNNIEDIGFGAKNVRTALNVSCRSMSIPINQHEIQYRMPFYISSMSSGIATSIKDNAYVTSSQLYEPFTCINNNTNSQATPKKYSASPHTKMRENVLHTGDNFSQNSLRNSRPLPPGVNHIHSANAPMLPNYSHPPPNINAMPFGYPCIPNHNGVIWSPWFPPPAMPQLSKSATMTRELPGYIQMANKSGVLEKPPANNSYIPMPNKSVGLEITTAISNIPMPNKSVGLEIPYANNGHISIPNKPVVLEMPPANNGYIPKPNKPDLEMPPANNGYIPIPNKPVLEMPPANNGYIPTPKKPVLEMPPANNGYIPTPKKPVLEMPPANNGYIPTPKKPVLEMPPANNGYIPTPKKPVVEMPPAKNISTYIPTPIRNLSEGSTILGSNKDGVIKTINIGVTPPLNKTEHVAKSPIKTRTEMFDALMFDIKKIIYETSATKQSITKLTTESGISQHDLKRKSTNATAPNNNNLPKKVKSKKAIPVEDKPSACYVGYSPPILPIPTYEKTLEIFANYGAKSNTQCSKKRLSIDDYKRRLECDNEARYNDSVINQYEPDCL